MRPTIRRYAAALFASAAFACSSDSITDPFAPMGLELTLSPAADTIFVADTIASSLGTRLTLSATSFGQPVSAPTGVEWTSSQPNIAVVDSTGGVRPVAVGSTIVTARVNDKRATATVLVAFGAKELTLSPQGLGGFVGDTLLVTASALDAKGALVPGTVYTFTAADPTIVSVTKTETRTARVIFIKAGAARVNVAAAGLTASATGTVLPKPAAGG
jgi:hypothetical protein